MKNMRTNTLTKELQKLLKHTKEFEPEVFRSFITYWLIRKSNSLDYINTLKTIKISNPNVWLSLIQSNHKFRTLYGEETADVLIGLIEKDDS